METHEEDAVSEGKQHFQPSIPLKPHPSEVYNKPILITQSRIKRLVTLSNPLNSDPQPMLRALLDQDEGSC